MHLDFKLNLPSQKFDNLNVGLYRSKHDNSNNTSSQNNENISSNRLGSDSTNNNTQRTQATPNVNSSHKIALALSNISTNLAFHD